MKRNRILSVLLCLALCLGAFGGLAGCSGDKGPKNPTVLKALGILDATDRMAEQKKTALDSRSASPARMGVRPLAGAPMGPGVIDWVPVAAAINTLPVADAKFWDAGLDPAAFADWALGADGIDSLSWWPGPTDHQAVRYERWFEAAYGSFSQVARAFLESEDGAALGARIAVEATHSAGQQWNDVIGPNLPSGITFRGQLKDGSSLWEMEFRQPFTGVGSLPGWRTVSTVRLWGDPSPRVDMYTRLHPDAEAEWERLPAGEKGDRINSFRSFITATLARTAILVDSSIESAQNGSTSRMREMWVSEPAGLRRIQIFPAKVNGAITDCIFAPGLDGRWWFRYGGRGVWFVELTLGRLEAAYADIGLEGITPSEATAPDGWNDPNAEEVEGPENPEALAEMMPELSVFTGALSESDDFRDTVSAAGGKLTVDIRIDTSGWGL